MISLIRIYLSKSSQIHMKSNYYLGNANKVYPNKLFLFCFEFDFPFFKHISGHIRTLCACSRGYDDHFIVLSHWHITPHGKHSRSNYYENGQLVFVLFDWTPLHLIKELQLPIWNLWFDSAGKRTPPFQTRSECSITARKWSQGIAKKTHKEAYRNNTTKSKKINNFRSWSFSDFYM